MPPLPIICLMACFIMPPLPIFFIMSAICLCCFSRRFNSCTSSPAPAAIRVPSWRSNVVQLLTGSAGVLSRNCAKATANSVRVFTLTYHSPTLQPGNTPYVKTEADLAAFLSNIESVLRFFQDRLGGTFSTLTQIERLARSRVDGAQTASAAH